MINTVEYKLNEYRYVFVRYNGEVRIGDYVLLDPEIQLVPEIFYTLRSTARSKRSCTTYLVAFGQCVCSGIVVCGVLSPRDWSRICL